MIRPPRLCLMLPILAALLGGPLRANCLGKINEHPDLSIKVGMLDPASGTWKAAGIRWTRTAGKTVYTTSVRKKDTKLNGVAIEATPSTVPVVEIFNAATAVEQSMPPLDHPAAKSGGPATLTFALDGGSTHVAWRIDGVANPKAGAACRKLLDQLTTLLTDEQKADLAGVEEPLVWSGDPERGGWQIHFSTQKPHGKGFVVGQEFHFVEILLGGQAARIADATSNCRTADTGVPQPGSEDPNEVSAQESPDKLPDAPLAAALSGFQKSLAIEPGPDIGAASSLRCQAEVTAGEQRFSTRLAYLPTGRNKRTVEDCYAALKKLLTPGQVKQLEKDYP